MQGVVFIAMKTGCRKGPFYNSILLRNVTIQFACHGETVEGYNSRHGEFKIRSKGFGSP